MTAKAHAKINPVTMTPTQARQQIETLIRRYRDLGESKRKEMTEASVAGQFVTPLLRALGWPAILPSANACATRSTRWWPISTD